METEAHDMHIQDARQPHLFATRKILKPSSEKELLKPSRKIQKKRSKYKKIDDSVRMQLFEAVKHRGEMLKTAANRLKINYSSAKSIFHTFRKEGRICKKSEKLRARKSASEKSEEPLIKEEEEVVELDTGASEVSSHAFSEELAKSAVTSSILKTTESVRQEELIKNLLLANNNTNAGLQTTEKNCLDNKSILLYINSLTKSSALLEKVKLLSQSLLLGSINEKGGYSSVLQEHLKSSLKSIIPSLKDLIFELQMLDSNQSNLNQTPWMSMLLCKALQQMTPGQLYPNIKPSMSE